MQAVSASCQRPHDLLDVARVLTSIVAAPAVSRTRHVVFDGRGWAAFAEVGSNQARLAVTVMEQLWLLSRWVCRKHSGASLRLVSVAIPPERWISLHCTDPGQPGYSQELLRRAEEVLNGSNLVEMILYGHLLLEHALDIRIQARFERADVLEDSKFARLGFAQKVTVYIGLYDPDPEWIKALQGFNRLRNRMAHSLVDLEQAALEFLPPEFGDVPLQKVRTAFLTLAMGELLAIQGALVDRHQPEEG